MTVWNVKLREVGAIVIAIVTFSVLLVLALIQLLETERTLHMGEGENLLWVLTQPQIELQRLIIAEATGESADDIRLRFDIAVSRFTVLREGTVHKRLNEDEQALVERVYADLIALEPMFANSHTPGDIQFIRDRLAPNIEVLRELANSKMIAENNRMGAKRDLYKNALIEVIMFIIGIMASGLFLIARLLSGLNRAAESDARLRREKNFLDLVIEASGDGIVAFDPTLRCTHWNSGMAAIFGLPAEEVVGKHILEVFSHPDDHVVTRLVEQTLQGETALIPAHFMPRYDKYLEKYGFPVRSDGKITAGVIIAQDVTERYRTHLELVEHRTRLEELVSERTATLERTEQQLLSAINTAPDGFAAFDAAGSLIVANAQARALLVDVSRFAPGTPLADILGNPVFEGRLSAETPVDSHAATQTTELELARGSWLMVTLRRTRHGTSVLRLADISTYKRAARTLENALAREQNLRQLYSDFVSMVSHQFRTPLAIIDSGAQRMLRRGAAMSMDEVVNRATKIRSAASRLAGLVEATLDAARMEAGEIEFRPQPSNLAAIVQDLCERQYDLHPERNFRFDLDDLPEEVSFDPILIDQVIDNMISNAIKYSPADSEIRIQGYVERGNVALSVEDRGVGIPSDEMPRIFGRYFRARTAAGIQGTGIGLYVAREIARLHGGDIHVASEEGRGTSVTLKIPLVPVEEPMLLS
ncbi:PAS domain-containing sensor histidine kinase [Rhizobiaceae bacterium n13]|uniref:histidine kinase n=1 Tax=Ferirhizobium litorale TaxID=2927786 RepID=A0AAE3U3C4_9HYPH|nr:ATP-binding protein [Fererhizobium litorale]MDI7861819.1 PAS domain-containing sensor histidine kinase [Fererhizobium litorale]MDI7921839.1 PAS domain-containing sensor histidine kinase [Fererhizobium litorale]